MIVDTGSFNIWVDAVPNTCSATCRGTFSGSGFVSGTECVGPVTVSGLTVPEQSFGNASSSGFSDADGKIDNFFLLRIKFNPCRVLGLRLVDFTEGTSTFLDNLYNEGIIVSPS